jgi:hypothetical protein
MALTISYRYPTLAYVAAESFSETGGASKEADH